MSFLIAGLLTAARISFKSQERFLILKNFQSSGQNCPLFMLSQSRRRKCNAREERDHHAARAPHALNCEYLGNHPRIAAATRDAWSLKARYPCLRTRKKRAMPAIES